MTEEQPVIQPNLKKFLSRDLNFQIEIKVIDYLKKFSKKIQYNHRMNFLFRYNFLCQLEFVESFRGKFHYRYLILLLKM
jgi:hypothetical protein